MLDDKFKPGTWGAFKAALEKAGVQDDDTITFDCNDKVYPWKIERDQNRDGSWDVFVV